MIRLSIDYPYTNHIRTINKPYNNNHFSVLVRSAPSRRSAVPAGDVWLARTPWSRQDERCIAHRPGQRWPTVGRSENHHDVWEVYKYIYIYIYIHTIIYIYIHYISIYIYIHIYIIHIYIYIYIYRYQVNQNQFRFKSDSKGINRPCWSQLVCFAFDFSAMVVYWRQFRTFTWFPAKWAGNGWKGSRDDGTLDDHALCL